LTALQEEARKRAKRRKRTAKMRREGMQKAAIVWKRVKTAKFISFSSNSGKVYANFVS